MSRYMKKLEVDVNARVERGENRIHFDSHYS